MWHSEEGKAGLKKCSAKALEISTGDLVIFPSTRSEEGLPLHSYQGHERGF